MRGRGFAVPVVSRLLPPNALSLASEGFQSRRGYCSLSNGCSSFSASSKQRSAKFHFRKDRAISRSTDYNGSNRLHSHSVNAGDDATESTVLMVLGGLLELWT